VFKLAAAIRNRFVVFPYLEVKAPSSRRAGQTLAPIAHGAGISSRSSGVAVPKQAWSPTTFSALQPRSDISRVERRTRRRRA
jgi:hypothetical protein